MRINPASLERAVAGFPNLRVEHPRGGAPIEVTLIAQLGHGAGSQLVAQTGQLQRRHHSFIDAHDEPSAKLGGVHAAVGDHSSLYSFVVGAAGHPFHCHAGSRVFTAVSGSSGTQLRFSTAELQREEADPKPFLEELHLVDIPPDCLFTVRFGSRTWHQFVPLGSGSDHPALFALSCHTDELGGLVGDPALRAEVLADRANIASLTEVLPAALQTEVARALARADVFRRSALAFEAPAESWRSRLCKAVRVRVGRWRSAMTKVRPQAGFASSWLPGLKIESLSQPAEDSLLRTHFVAARIDHDDGFRCRIADSQWRNRSAVDLLDALLEAFVQHPPAGVTGLMLLRNALVRPLRLRRSRLGCPVSSLAGRDAALRFAGRHPVLAQATATDGSAARVLLGADDRHLRFRTEVSVLRSRDGCFEVSLSTRVHCLNAFGRFYMAMIDRVHRHYVSPTLLRHAVAAVILAPDIARAEPVPLAPQ